MTSIDIMECNDAETLKKIALAQAHILFMIGEVCVSESKWHYTSEVAIEKIRSCLVKGQHEMEDFK
jgi:hypothetical protein